MRRFTFWKGHQQTFSANTSGLYTLSRAMKMLFMYEIALKNASIQIEMEVFSNLSK